MHKKTQLIQKIIASGLLFLALAPQGSQIAQSQERSAFLLRLNCVDTGIGNWARRVEDVAVGKAVYTSRLYMGAGDSDSVAALTCRLQPNEQNVIFQTLNLEFGMRDNYRRRPDVVVKVYLDGVQAQSQTVSPGGQPASVSLDVTTTNNVSIEAECSSKSQYCDRVYFWQASLGIAP
ncbi:NPCBM/NEW2 domain-containing protein [Coleofasciculus sp. LEGE 07092]|nr:NPCBM/NEW2 domain-containing protein [Coleofasciculus sp. LEGE 07081]MBE9151577.1 NPCBM/NEW2 domain-containing protein [Coleofasciculus sp. LEGE 07092]